MEPVTGNLINHYRLVSQIGKGGMGEVYLAQDMRLGRQIALKLLSEELTVQPRTRAPISARGSRGFSTQSSEHPHYSRNWPDGISTRSVMQSGDPPSLRVARGSSKHILRPRLTVTLWK
jgi:serine/threonine protein kinase